MSCLASVPRRSAAGILVLIALVVSGVRTDQDATGSSIRTATAGTDARIEAGAGPSKQEPLRDPWLE